MLKKLKYFIKHSSFYWRYRQFLNRNVWQGYAADWNSKRRKFYSDFVIRHETRSVFEFGCASGPNLHNIQNHCKEVPILFGFDINESALCHARSLLGPSVILESHNFFASAQKVLEFFNLKYFDLGIYDRVAYLLSDEQLHAHLNFCSQNVKYIVLDDFSGHDTLNNGNHPVRDFNELFYDHGFLLICEEKSEHLGFDNFSLKFAKRFVFQNSNL